MSLDSARQALAKATGRGVTVAVLDNGWTSAFTDPRVLPSPSAVPDNADVGHGATCIARVLQVAPEARVLPVRVFGQRLEASFSDICQGIEIALESGAQVINLSLATRLEAAGPPLFEACQRARRAGVVVVASAHNQGWRAFPAWLEPVLSTGAGPWRDLLDHSYTPGAAIECTAAAAGVAVEFLDGSSRHRSGSSVAAATMSGLVARMVGMGVQGLDQVREHLTLTAVAVPTSAS